MTVTADPTRVEGSSNSSSQPDGGPSREDAYAAASRLVDEALSAEVTGDCDTTYAHWYFSPDDTEQEADFRANCESSPIDAFALESPFDEADGDITRLYPGAIEVPFTFTRDGETEHDNLDVISIDDEYYIFRT